MQQTLLLGISVNDMMLVSDKYSLLVFAPLEHISCLTPAHILSACPWEMHMWQVSNVK